MKHNYNKTGVFISFAFICVLITGIALLKSDVFDFFAGDAAGFGIAPPFINAETMEPGEKIVKKITIMRNQAENDRTISLRLDNPEIADWITFSPGQEFLFAAGDTRMAFTVEIKVPEKAFSGSYPAKLAVNLGVPKKSGQVAIGLGAQVDINLSVNNPDSDNEGRLKITNKAMHERLKGRILIKVEDRGRAFYVHPDFPTMYSLGSPRDALALIQDLALFPKQEGGMFYFLDSKDKTQFILQNTADMLRIMRDFGLGISNRDFDRLIDN